jgi:long-chain acyl-CoA synthetase
LNIAETLHSSARRAPNSQAVTDSVGSTTYGQLSDRVSRLARGLREGLKLQPGDRIAIYLENTAVYFELLFAGWTAGLCVVPINAKLHPREVLQIASASGARACFSSGSLHVSLLDLPFDEKQQVVAVESDLFADLCCHDPLPVSEVEPSDPAWIFFTSGTTGLPKGATLSHRNLLVMSYCYLSDIDELDDSDTNVHLAPLSHAGGLYSLPHFIKGSHQVVLSSHFEADNVFDALSFYPNVTIFAAPTVLSRLVTAARGREIQTDNLKTVIFGGSPMYVADLEQAIDWLGPKLYHLYGQGESPMTISGLGKRDFFSTDDSRMNSLLQSSGYARTGVEIRIVDGRGKTVAAGVSGEVTVRSDCVMIGYWEDPDATKDAIRDGWLHTGDIGSMDEFGLLTLKERSKDVIISGGSNIYPREIEEVLVRHPSVLECSVVGRPHPDWGEEVVAFVVTAAGCDVNEDALDKLCLESIARFKRPRHYLMVHELPKNGAGKVVKTELRKLAIETMEVI